MRLTLINYWSILLGFTLTLLAFSGMVLAVFFPEVIAIEITPNRAISALEVPLRPISTSASQPEEEIQYDFETSLNSGQEPEIYQDAPVRIRRSPSKGAITTTTEVGEAAPKVERAVSLMPSPEEPIRIVISSIDLSAQIIPAPVDFETIAGKEYLRWSVPNEFAVGWHTTSAMLGEVGNTVLNGHHNAYGEVFVSLVDVEEGDIIWVDSVHNRYIYQVTNKMILPEKYEQLDVRMNNAQWLLPTVDERLTLITCWPYETNTHRLIIVARPIGKSDIPTNLE